MKLKPHPCATSIPPASIKPCISGCLGASPPGWRGLQALQSHIPFVVTFVLQGLFEEMDGNAPAQPGSPRLPSAEFKVKVVFLMPEQLQPDSLDVEEP